MIQPVRVGAPLRNPEDVALAPNGDLYVVDSAHLQPAGDQVPALYRIPAGSSEIETLYAGMPLRGPVDLLLVTR